MNKDLFDLFLQRFEVEWLGDVGRAGLSHSQHLLGPVSIREDHDERRIVEPAVDTHFLQQLQSGHRHHIPVADYQAEITGAQSGQGFRATGCFLHIVKLDLLQHITDNTPHGTVVVDDQHIDGFVDCHRGSSFEFPNYLEKIHYHILLDICL